MTHRRRATRWIALGLSVVLAFGVAACDKQPTPGGATTTTQVPLPFRGSPSRADVEAATGLHLPASSSDYRSARVGEGELDVTFRFATGDIEAFISGSKLPALRTERLIAHPSPVWSLDPGGPVRSTSTTRRGLRIGAEIVDGGATSTVRLIIASGG